MSSRSQYTPQYRQFLGQVDTLDKIRPIYFSLVNLIVLILCAIYGASAYQTWNVVKQNPSWFDEFSDLHLKNEKVGFGASFARIAWGVLIAIPLLICEGWWLFAIGIGNLAFEIPIVDVLTSGYFLPDPDYVVRCSSGPTDDSDISRCNFYTQYSDATGSSADSVEDKFITQAKTLYAFSIVALAGLWIGIFFWAVLGKFKGKDKRRGGVEAVAGIFSG